MKSFSNIKKWEPKNRTQLFLLFTAVYFFTAILAFCPFFLLHRSLLLYNDDGFLQHYEAIFQLKHTISQLLSAKEFSFWAWNMGLGTDNIGTMSYVYCDPFNYIAAAFPDRHVELGYTIMILIQIYTLGAAFLYFGKIVNLQLKHCFWGALAYCFSTWVILAAYRHSFFLTVAIIFLFLMTGVEKVLRKQSPIVLIISTFFSAIFSLYFSYMSALVLFLYLVIYYIQSDGKSLKQFFRFWGSFVLYVGIAICMAFIIMIPELYTLQHAITDSATVNTALFSFSTYVNYFISLAGGNEIFGQYSSIASSSLFLILLPCIFHRIWKKQGTPAMLTLLFCMIFLLFPIFNSIFNGLGYPTGRWCYSATFFLIWSALQCMEDPEFAIQKYRKPILAGLAVLVFLTIYVARIILAINWELPVILSVTNLTAAFLFFWLLSTKAEKKRWQTIMISLTMVVNIILVGHIRFSPGCSTQIYDFMQFGEIYDIFDRSTQKAGTEIQDDDFYRIDQADHVSSRDNKALRTIDNMANETMVFQTRPLYSYLSTISGTFYDFYRMLSNSAGYYRRVSTMGNDNRSRLDFLMGTKYFLGNNPQVTPSTGAEDYASYGFSKDKKSSQGVEILKNKNALGLGCTFTSYISESEWQTLSYPDREQALMECVVLPDSSSSNLKHRDPSSISSGSHTVSYHFVKSSGMKAGKQSLRRKQQFKEDGNFKVTKKRGSVTLQLDEELQNHEIYLLFDHLTRKPDSVKTYKMKNKVDRIRGHLSGKMQEDHGSYSIKAKMGKVTKCALNLVEDIQGFSDVEDLMVNLGRYKSEHKEITISFEDIGSYQYDSISVIAVPLDTYKTSAKTCMNHALELTDFSDNAITGTVNTDTSHSMLYLSIPFHDGWKAYVDGKETPIQKIDISFSGIPLKQEGKHQIELRFRPVGYSMGLPMFAIGLFLCIIVLVRHHRRKKI